MSSRPVIRVIIVSRIALISGTSRAGAPRDRDPLHGLRPWAYRHGFHHSHERITDVWLVERDVADRVPHLLVPARRTVAGFVQRVGLVEATPEMGGRHSSDALDKVALEIG